MKISEAEPKIVGLIHKYLPDYDFQWDTATRRFGCCRGNRKLITMSKTLTKLNVWEDVKDTCLHEIAHGLAGVEHQHDDYWKSWCVKIGARPERCYGSHIKRPLPKLVGTCPNCGRQITGNRRRDISCGKCCKTYNPKYKFIWRER